MLPDQGLMMKRGEHEHFLVPSLDSKGCIPFLGINERIFLRQIV